MNTKTTIRSKQLIDLGLKFNPSCESFVGYQPNTSDINVHWTEIAVLSDDEWDNMIKDISSTLDLRKQEIEIYQTELHKINLIEQAQFSLNLQLRILKQFSEKLGLYDASDYLKV